MNKKLVFHHNDPDGYLSAAIIKKAIGDENVDCVSCSYNRDTDFDAIDYEEYDECILVDFSFPADKMEFLLDGFGNGFIWIDHHITAKKQLAKYWNNKGICGKRDITHSACRLTWDYFVGIFSEKTIPKIVSRVEDFDIWKWEFKDTKHVSEYSRIIGDDLYLWKELLDDSVYDEQVKNGVVLTELKNKVVDNDKKHPMIYYYDEDEVFGDYTVAIKNSTMYKSHLGNAIVRDFELNDECENPDIAIIYEFCETGVSLALRSIGDIDVSIVAQRLGGGGHKNAAGCLVTWKKFYELFLEV